MKNGKEGLFPLFPEQKARRRAFIFRYSFFPSVFRVQTQTQYSVGPISNLASKVAQSSVCSNARVYISLASNRIDAQRNEHTVLPEKSRMANLTERLFLLDHRRLWGSGSRPMSKLWQALLPGPLFDKKSTLYMASPKIPTNHIRIHETS